MLFSLCSKGMLEVLGIRVKAGKEIETRTYFSVSNHLSYTDILVIASHHPCAFLTSLEMKNASFTYLDSYPTLSDVFL